MPTSPGNASPIRPASMSVAGWILLVSLGLNLFLAGLWLGSRSDFPQFVPPPFTAPQPRPVTLGERLASQLSPEGLAKVEGPIAQLDSVMRRGFEERQEIFDQLRELVAAEPYDAAAVKALLDRLPEQRLSGEGAQWNIVADILGSLSDHDRRAFADSVFLRPPVMRSIAPPPLQPGR